MKSEEVRYSRRNQIVRITSYKYNSKDKLISQKRFNSQGKLTAKTVRDYDKNGIYEKMRIDYDVHGIKKKTVTEKSDEMGQRLSGSIYGRGMKKVLNFEIQERDSLGNELKQVFTKPGGAYFLTITKEYDIFNQKVFEYYEGKHKKKYEYNEVGITKEISLDLHTGEPIRLVRYVYTLE